MSDATVSLSTSDLGQVPPLVYHLEDDPRFPRHSQIQFNGCDEIVNFGVWNPKIGNGNPKSSRLNRNNPTNRNFEFCLAFSAIAIAESQQPRRQNTPHQCSRGVTGNEARTTSHGCVLNCFGDREFFIWNKSRPIDATTEADKVLI